MWDNHRSKTTVIMSTFQFLECSVGGHGSIKCSRLINSCEMTVHVVDGMPIRGMFPANALCISQSERKSTTILALPSCVGVRKTKKNVALFFFIVHQMREPVGHV